MEKLEVKKIIKISNNDLNKITNWMYNWWGKEDNYSFEEVKCRMEHSLQEKGLPQTYGLFLNNELIGMYQFVYEEFIARPDIYPWLANLYIDAKYQGKGYGKILIENVANTAKDNVEFNEIYLYTTHIGLYEKFGYTYISDIDTYSEVPRVQRLYKIEL